MHPFSTPWKLQKTVRFPNVFRGQRRGALGTNGLANEINSSNLSFQAAGKLKAAPMLSFKYVFNLNLGREFLKQELGFVSKSTKVFGNFNKTLSQRKLNAYLLTTKNVFPQEHLLIFTCISKPRCPKKTLRSTISIFWRIKHVT